MKISLTTQNLLLAATLVVGAVLVIAYIYIETHLAPGGAAALCNYPGEAHPLSILEPCFK